MKHEQSFGIIPLQKREGIWYVYLVQLHAGHWGFPKGHPNAEEEPHEVAKRELFEETCLTTVKFLSDQSLVEHYQFMFKGTLIKKKVTYFLAEVKGDTVIQKEEIAEGKWLPLSQAESQITFKEAKRICRQAIEIIEKG